MATGEYKLGREPYMKQYWIDNPIKYLLHNAKMRANKTGIEFNLIEDDIIIPEFCPILGIKLGQVRASNRDATPSLDRIDNSKGYVKDNIAVISFRANRYKSNMTIKDIEALYKYVSSRT